MSWSSHFDEWVRMRSSKVSSQPKDWKGQCFTFPPCCSWPPWSGARQTGGTFADSSVPIHFARSFHIEMGQGGSWIAQWQPHQSLDLNIFVQSCCIMESRNFTPSPHQRTRMSINRPQPLYTSGQNKVGCRKSCNSNLRYGTETEFWVALWMLDKELLKERINQTCDLLVHCPVRGLGQFLHE